MPEQNEEGHQVRKLKVVPDLQAEDEVSIPASKMFQKRYQQKEKYEPLQTEEGFCLELRERGSKTEPQTEYEVCEEPELGERYVVDRKQSLLQKKNC